PAALLVGTPVQKRQAAPILFAAPARLGPRRRRATRKRIHGQWRLRSVPTAWQPARADRAAPGGTRAASRAWPAQLAMPQRARLRRCLRSRGPPKQLLSTLRQRAARRRYA